jgi:hypothetical protein
MRQKLDSATETRLVFTEHVRIKKSLNKKPPYVGGLYGYEESQMAAAAFRGYQAAAAARFVNCWATIAMPSSNVRGA